MFALGYGLHGRGVMVRFPALAGNFSLIYGVHTGSETHPVSYSVDNMNYILGMKKL
jgi:hypothetical protein